LHLIPSRSGQLTECASLMFNGRSPWWRSTDLNCLRRGGSGMDKRLSAAEVLAQLPAARRRAARERAAGLRANSVRYDRKTGRLILELSNGFLFGVPVASLAHIATANADQLASVELSPEGGVLRIEALDADYSVAGLVLSMSAGEVGRHGGKVRSAAKAKAARANGAKGGRPRRVRA